MAPSGFNRQTVGASIEFGSLWATVVLAVVLLGLIGVCWWHLGEWERGPEDDEPTQITAEALGHTLRTRGIVLWVQVMFVITAAGAIAELVGAVMERFGTGGVASWASDFDTGANTLAVLAIAVTGVLFGRHLTSRYDSDASTIADSP